MQENRSYVFFREIAGGRAATVRSAPKAWR